MVDEVTVDQVYSEYIWFSPANYHSTIALYSSFTILWDVDCSYETAHYPIFCL